MLITLQVKGRASGRSRSSVLVLTEYNGQSYVVSMLGEKSEWIRNVRARVATRYCGTGCVPFCWQ